MVRVETTAVNKEMMVPTARVSAKPLMIDEENQNNTAHEIKTVT